MRVKRNHLLIIGAIVIAALLFSGRGRYIGGISPQSAAGASGGANNVSALPRGYRSEAPNSPYVGTPVQ